MASTGSDAIPILSLFASAFSPTVFPRVQLLAVACLLATGRLSEIVELPLIRSQEKSS